MAATDDEVDEAPTATKERKIFKGEVMKVAALQKEWANTGVLPSPCSFCVSVS